MNKMFCQACGKATEFTFSKPSSCVWCKTAFGAFIPQTSDKAKKNPVFPSDSPSSSPSPKQNINLGFELDNFGVDNEVRDDSPTDSIEINIDVPTRKQTKTTIGQIVSSAGTNPPPPTPIVAVKSAGRKASLKKILQEFQKEAGAIKPQSHLRGTKPPKK